MGQEDGLTERQRKWFASVRASLERETGKSLAEWVEIARACPQTRPRARARWLKETYGLGINRASYVLGEAFPSHDSWSQPDALRAKLWSDPQSEAILQAIERAAAELEGVTVGQRKGFTAFSRKVQFAAVRPTRAGGAMLGLALPPESDPRLEASRNESWSERLKSRTELESPSHVDVRIVDLMRTAWELS